MKKIKKLMITLIAVCMVFTMSVPAVFADGGYTITINGTKGGHDYGAYQLFQGTLDSQGKILTNIEWGSGINGPEFLTYLKNTAGNNGAFAEGDSDNVFAACVSAEDVANVLSKYADNDSMLDKFAKAANQYLTNVKKTSTYTAEAPLVYTITGVQAGYYMIKDIKTYDSTQEPQIDFNTKIILAVAGNATVTVKGKIPDIDKTVSATKDKAFKEYVDAQIGTAVYFKIEGTLPSNYAIYDSYYYEFVDTLPEGLTFDYSDLSDGVSDLPEVYISRVVNGVETHVTIPAGLHVMNYDAEKRIFTVKIQDLKADGMPTLLMEDKIVVKYRTKVNGAAIVGNGGNENTAYLKFTNDPYTHGIGKTENDEAKVYTFAMDLSKVDAANNSLGLNGAHFVMYTRNVETDSNGQEKYVYRYVTFIDDGDGGRTVTGWLESDPEDKSTPPAEVWKKVKDKYPDAVEQMVLVSNKINNVDGKIKVKGLDAHVYHLHEVVAPEMYNLPKDPFVLSIEPSYNADGTITKLEYELDSIDVVDPEAANRGSINVTIQNGKGNTLPSTGGIGTTIFYLFGGLLVLAALVLMITKRRMRSNEQ